MSGGFVERMCCGGWCTSWGATDEQRKYWPPRHSDFRDSAPEQLQHVYELYQPVVKNGRWTMGLLEMWFWKGKPVKHSVHIPCWDSFKWNPLKWRGPCFGRTFNECYWTGLRQARWARAVYAAGLGREYVMPVRDIGRHGYKSDIKALCWMYFLMGMIFGCGIGEVINLCGACEIINFGAWYSCHARERLRRRYNLPPMCCMPPGIDDCLVHFFCMYCAVHQELRELAVRGVDGPGMHILDVLPESFNGVEGIEEVKAERRKLLEGMLARPPKMFRARGRPHLQRCHARYELFAADQAANLATTQDDDLPVFLTVDVDETEASFSPTPSDTSSAALGWCRYCPPEPQEMMRQAVGPDAQRMQLCREPAGRQGAGDDQQAVLEAPACPALSGGGRPDLFPSKSVHHIPVLVEEPPPGLGPQASKAWSVGY